MCGPVRASPGGRIEYIVVASGSGSDIYDISSDHWSIGKHYCLIPYCLFRKVTTNT